MSHDREQIRLRLVTLCIRGNHMMRAGLILLMATTLSVTAQPGPSGAAAYDAAIKAGRMVEAARLLEDGLKDTNYRDPDLLLRAARRALMHGEYDRAQSLYKLLADVAPAKSGTMRESLEFMLERGADPEVYLKFCDQFGASDPVAGWRYGYTLVERLLRDARVQESVTVLERLLRDHGEQGSSMYSLMQLIDGQISSGTYTQPGVLERVFKIASAAPGMSEHVLHRLINSVQGPSSAETRARMVLQVHQHRPLVESWDLIRNIEQANSIPDAGVREQIGQSWLEVAAAYDASDKARARLHYLQTLANMPNVFRNTGLLDAAGLNERMASLREVYGEVDGAFQNLLVSLQRNYIGNDQGMKIAFYKRWGAELPDNLLGDFYAIGWNDDNFKPGLNEIIKAMPRERRYVMSQTLAIYGQRIGSKPLTAQAALDMMLWDPAGFNAGNVWSIISGFKTFTSAEKVAIVKPWVERVGTSSSWKALLERMSQDEMLSQSPEFKAFAAALPGIKGTDVLAKALVNFSDMPAKPEQFDPRLMQVFKAGLDSLPGDISAELRATHPLEYQWARALNSACYRHVEKNREGNLERMMAWASRLKETDDTWYWMFRTLIEDQRRGDAWDLIPAYVEAVKAAGNTGRVDWNQLRDLR
ncbi:MAG: hypothetical protein ACO398_11010, partial [Kiritimatiellia bacterium]